MGQSIAPSGGVFMLTLLASLAVGQDSATQGPVALTEFAAAPMQALDPQATSLPSTFTVDDVQEVVEQLQPRTRLETDEQYHARLAARPRHPTYAFWYERDQLSWVYDAERSEFLGRLSDITCELRNRRPECDQRVLMLRSHVYLGRPILGDPALGHQTVELSYGVFLPTPKAEIQIHVPAPRPEESDVEKQFAVLVIVAGEPIGGSLTSRGETSLQVGMGPYLGSTLRYYLRIPVASLWVINRTSRKIYVKLPISSS